MTRWSLRVKLAALLVVVSFIPVCVVALLDIRATRARTFADAAGLLAARADQLVGELDAFNGSYQRAVSRLAHVPEVVAFLHAVSVGPPPSPSAIAARLAVHIDGDPAVRGIGLLDRAGRVQAATEPELVGAERRFRAYVRRGLEGTPWISEPYLADSGELAIAYVSPVLGPDHAVDGIAVFWIRAEAMWTVARKSNELAGARSFAVVLDHDGVRIAHTYSRDIVFHPAGVLPPETIDRLVAERRFGAATRELVTSVRAFPAQFERARAERCDPELFHGFAPVNQQSNYGVARRLATASWTVFYMVPAATLWAPITDLTTRRLIEGLGVALIALVAGLWLAAKLARPIQRLASATAALSAGNLAIRVDLDRRDELGQLGEAFDSMAAQLERQAGDVHRSRLELERLVEQRTAELVTSNASLRTEVGGRARAEAAVREREQSLATTLDSIGDAVIVTDNAGAITRMNPVAEALTGWTLADAAGRSLDEVFRIINERSRDVVESPVQRVLRDGQIVGLANHTVLIARAGTERPIADSAAPIIDKDAAIRGVVLVFRDMTADRDAQRQLVASEQRYRELYEGSPDMYLTAALPSDEIADCNDTLCERLGYAKAELLGQPFYMVYHPDYRATETGLRAQFHQGGAFVDVERTLRRKDGSSIEVSLNLRGIRDEAGQLIAARAVWRDISTRKQIERDQQLLIRLGETLRESVAPAELLEAVSSELGGHLRAARCMFAEFDLEADQVTIHRDYHAGLPSLRGQLALSSVAGTVREYERGVSVVVCDTATDPRTAPAYAPAYAPRSIRALITVPLMREGRCVAALSVCARERRVWEEREVALVKLVAERVWLWIEHLDALARLRDRDVAIAVQHTEDRFRTLVEAVRDYAIFMLDPEGNVATWNAGAARIKGYAASEIIGRNFSVFSTAEDQARAHPRFMLDEARTHGRYEEESWRVRKDGSRFWATLVITPVRDRDGVLEGFAEVTRDSTLRRTQDEVLRVKQEALAQSLKEREVLLQEVHHRVKNNLQVISSLINMQVRKLDPGPTREALEECKTRVLAIALIHEKLYQSKDYSQVRFAEYARSLAANVFHATGISQREVTLELAIGEIPLGVDRAIPCGLVINELITNSLKHGFPDARPGHIRVELIELEGGRLRLTVQDSGVGLPDGFDIQNVASMGLQLVTTLAEQLDATLVVSNAGGASFQLTFARSG